MPGTEEWVELASEPAQKLNKPGWTGLEMGRAGPKVNRTGLAKIRKKSVQTSMCEVRDSVILPAPVLARVFHPQTQTPELENLASPSTFPHHPHLLSLSTSYLSLFHLITIVVLLHRVSR